MTRLLLLNWRDIEIVAADKIRLYLLGNKNMSLRPGCLLASVLLISAFDLPPASTQLRLRLGLGVVMYGCRDGGVILQDKYGTCKLSGD